MNKKLDKLRENILIARNRMYAALEYKYKEGSSITFTLNCRQLTPSKGIVRGADGDGYLYIKLINCKENSRKSVRRIFYTNIVGN